MSIRPAFRVAAAGLDPRDVRLIEIVFQHSRYNPHDFRMAGSLDSERPDILIVNPTEPAGLAALAAAGAHPRPIPSVSAVPRGAQASARYSITLDRLTLQLLPILNRLIETEGLASVTTVSAAPLCDELTDIHVDDHPATGSARDPDSLRRIRARNPAVARQAPLDAVAAVVASRAAATAIAQAADRAAVEPPRRPPAPHRARLQVLVADPSVAAQQQLVRALRRIGLEVQCVASAAAAMQYLGSRHVDLVITESGLTDGDGFDLIRRMRSRVSHRYTPVLLLRSRLHVFDSTRARLAGDVAVLTKPLTRHALESEVRRALRSSVILDDLNELLAPA